MQRIAIYGKGGVGKSVIATGLSVSFALEGRRVLHVGCDPKHDSSIRLMDDPSALRTVLDVMGTDPTAVPAGRMINAGRHGIHIIESGGPTPGLGCAGRGVARAMELLEESAILESKKYDVVVFDVLGDVVCGGFAAPLRQGFAREVFVVVSNEPMALFAANNITKAVLTYQENGIRLGGLVANLRNARRNDSDILHDFAQRLNTKLVAVLEYEPRVQEAERQHQTIVEYAPDSTIASQFRELSRALLLNETSEAAIPTPLDEKTLFEFLRRT